MDGIEVCIRESSVSQRNKTNKGCVYKERARFILRNCFMWWWMLIRLKSSGQDSRLEIPGRVDVAVQVQRPVCWWNSLFRGD